MARRYKWAIWHDGIYDLSDYFNTISLLAGNGATSEYTFLDSSITQYFQQLSGQDITKELDASLAAMDPTLAAQHRECLNNAFYRGITDFRKSAKCVAPNVIPLVFAGMICVIILAKCKPLPFPCSSQVFH